MPLRRFRGARRETLDGAFSGAQGIHHHPDASFWLFLRLQPSPLRPEFPGTSCWLEPVGPSQPPTPSRVGPHGWRPLRVEWGGWVSSDRVPAEPGSLASHSPSGFDYITLHRRELKGSGSLRRHKDRRTAGSCTRGIPQWIWGCLPLKTKIRNGQPKEGKPACNLSIERN